MTRFMQAFAISHVNALCTLSRCDRFFNAFNESVCAAHIFTQVHTEQSQVTANQSHTNAPITHKIYTQKCPHKKRHKNTISTSRART